MWNVDRFFGAAGLEHMRDPILQGFKELRKRGLRLKTTKVLPRGQGNFQRSCKNHKTLIFGRTTQLNFALLDGNECPVCTYK